MTVTFNSSATSLESWMDDFKSYMLRSRQVRGLAPATLGVTNNPSQDVYTRPDEVFDEAEVWSFLNQGRKGGAYMDPDGAAENSYRERRFKILSGEIGVRSRARNVNGKNVVGVGFNLDSAIADEALEQSLGLSTSTIGQLRSGERELAPEEARRLFDYTTRPVEDVINQSAQARGRTLSDRERIGLVGLEMISPGSGLGVLQSDIGDTGIEAEAILAAGLEGNDLDQASQAQLLRFASFYNGWLEDGGGNLPNNTAGIPDFMEQAKNADFSKNDMAKTISALATDGGVDANIAVAIASIESGLNPNAKNPRSSARGLFQFINSTRTSYGLAKNASPSEQASAGIRLTRDNINGLKSALGRAPSPGQVYAAHFLGLGGAKSLFRHDGKTNLRSALGKRANAILKANPFMRKMRTVSDFQDWADRKMSTHIAKFS